MANNDKEFPTKYLKKIDGDFTDGINAMDTEEIKKRILECEGNIYEIDADKDNNNELKDMKQKMKEAVQPYSETKGKETAKIKYCLYVLESRGIRLEKH